MSKSIEVDVVYAEAARQWRWRLSLPAGSTVADAIAACPIAQLRPQWSVEQAGVGLFGRSVAPDCELTAGDRVELYRPLLCDPKEVRRQRALRER
ncbi:RnfH family protein [Pseudomarimonas arenosa]|uniref:UPF0125 protein IFO71_02045 n=1 Tax=Pseudomarimonas arenosa TaxID=2774145 RepID=A0AAW3ZJP2_9GAMM|nr:RnfH family protein [Pseudomarimonas arenosa]